MNIIIGYFGAFFAFILLDALWILGLARNFYRKGIGHLFRDDILLIPALLFYICYVGILLFLIILPNVETDNLSRLLISSALFGVAAYGTYDITNYALLKNWPLSVTIVDICWGAFVTTLCSAAGYFAIKLFA